jgi:hypothetical protein
MIPDGSVFNLQMLQRLLGQTEESAKKWAKRHGVPCIKGTTWVFSGTLFRIAIEPAMIAALEERLRKGALKK